MIIPSWQETIEDQSHNEYQEMTPRFLPRFACLPASYVLVVAIHSLGRSRSNRHHTSNPQSGAAQPTQDEDSQATNNPLEYLLALCRGKVKNPSQYTDRSQRQSPTPLNNPPITGPAGLANTKSNKNFISPNHPTSAT